MRLAVDLTSLAYNYSGIEQYAYHLTRALAYKNNPLELSLIFANEVYQPLADVVSLSHVRTHVIRPKRQNKLLVMQIDLPRALRAIKADVYLFPAFPQPLTFRHPGAVSVIHDVSFWDCPQTLTTKSLLYWRVCAAHAARRQLVFTVSEFSKGRIADKLHVDPSRICVAPNGVAPRFAAANESLDRHFYQELRTKYNLPERFVLSLCTLEPRKNLSQLVDAWTLAAQRGQDIPDLVLAGRRGWKVDKLLSSVPSFLAERIHLTGFVDQEDLPHLYHICDRFVCPSRYEGFGLPPLEALAAGAPVLCSDIPVFHETCGESVTFFPLDDVEALAQLLLATAAPNIGGKAVCERYNWEKAADIVRDALEGLT